MELLPGDALRVGDPVFFALGVAAGGGAFVQQGQVGGLGAGFEGSQLGRVVGLETEVIQARFVAPVTPRLQVLVFGGPSFVQVKQGLVSGFSWKDEYPYDQATLVSTQTASGHASALGFHAGGDVAFFFGPGVGVGGSVQVSGATLKLTAGNAQATINAGGVQAGGGLRVRF